MLILHGVVNVIIDVLYEEAFQRLKTARHLMLSKAIFFFFNSSIQPDKTDMAARINYARQ